MNRSWYILKCVVLGVLFFFVIGLAVQLLWNWLVPSIFHGPTIDYWQALGIFVLSKILFWGLGGKHHHYQHGESSHWKNKFAGKFSNMSSEEREALKQKMKDKWCSWDKSASTKEPGDSNE